MGLQGKAGRVCSFLGHSKGGKRGPAGAPGPHPGMFAIPLASLPKSCPRWRRCCSKWCPPCPEPAWHLAGLEPGVFWGWRWMFWGELASQVCIFSSFPAKLEMQTLGRWSSCVLAAGFSLAGMLWMQNAPGVRCEPGVNLQHLLLAGGNHTGPGTHLPSHGTSAIRLCSWLKVPGWPRQRVRAPSPQLLHWDGCGEGKGNSSFHWALLGFLSLGALLGLHSPVWSLSGFGCLLGSPEGLLPVGFAALLGKQQTFGVGFPEPSHGPAWAPTNSSVPIPVGTARHWVTELMHPRLGSCPRSCSPQRD